MELTDYKKHAQLLSGKLRARGYPDHLLRRADKRARVSPRETLLHPSSRSIGGVGCVSFPASFVPWLRGGPPPPEPSRAEPTGPQDVRRAAHTGAETHTARAQHRARGCPRPRLLLPILTQGTHATSPPRQPLHPLQARARNSARVGACRPPTPDPHRPRTRPTGTSDFSLLPSLVSGTAQRRLYSASRCGLHSSSSPRRGRVAPPAVFSVICAGSLMRIMSSISRVIRCDVSVVWDGSIIRIDVGHERSSRSHDRSRRHLGHAPDFDPLTSSS
ncbi:hypothetical protein NDU88_005201 [Pleurodeles waltl]|uniref:Uncharacterized protein n=1 Tax=Pleurodeles waltl TaxID=8319 RepID=A0AAV7TTN7_PLEWA|nr:hypothetical protein NDU88_005201 [Pleurodeles waltl]